MNQIDPYPRSGFQIRTLSTERLGKRVGRIIGVELQEIIEGLFELVA